MIAAAESGGVGGPRVLAIDLARLEPGRRHERAARAFSDREPALARLGALGGSALALALLARAERGGGEPALALAVGDGVRRALPTAARLTLVARSPLHGGLAEGLVGGDLAARLASRLDGLLLAGRAPVPSVLRLAGGAGGALTVALEPAADLVPLDVDERAARLAPIAGGAVLLAGPAAPRVAFAHAVSATYDGGGVHLSRTGRAGLGAVLARLGLVAIVVELEPAAALARRGRASELVRALRASPRLAARSEGGTLELWDAHAARGDVDAELGRRIAGEARRAARERHGCRGCPTPCGIAFARAHDETGRAAHFGATAAFAPLLPGASFDELAAALDAADRAGLDALESAAVLALAEAHGERLGFAPLAREPRARAAELVARIEALGRGVEPLDRLAAGAASLAATLGVRARGVVRGRAVRGERAPLARVAERWVAGGSDPWRAFPALVEGAEPAALRRQAPWLEAGASADAPAAGGRLLAWLEALAAACDATGFCAFSAGALLADGVATLDQLALWTAGASSAQDLARDGARVAFARAALDARHGASRGGHAGRTAAPDDEAPELRELAHAYRAWRGIGADGAPTAVAWDAFERGDVPGPDERVTGERTTRRAADGHGARELLPQAHVPDERAVDERAVDERAMNEHAARERGGERHAAVDSARGRFGRFECAERTERTERIERTECTERVERAECAERLEPARAELAAAADRVRPTSGVSEAARRPLATAVRLRASGALARALGADVGDAADVAVELDAPATVRAVLERAATRSPAARDLLLEPDGTPRPSVWSGGRRRYAGDAVEDGDVLDLVLVLSGG